jgi:hypothetical protein
MKKLAIVLGTTLLPGVALAHPDHASGGHFGLVHFLTDPFHLGLTAAAVGLFLVARRQLLRRRQAKIERS